MMKRTIPRLFAHRGCSGSAPENTLAAFRLASERGIPAVELDVRLARGGEVYIMHDGNLKRVAGIDSDVAGIDWSELRTIDVGSWFSAEFSSERIPLLDDLFEDLGGSLFYDIELKTDLKTGDPLPGKVAEIIARHGLEERCMVSSFNPFAPRAFRRCQRGEPKKVPVSVIYSNSGYMPWILRHGAGCLFTRCEIAKPHWKQAGRGAVSRHHAMGRRVAVWTVDDRETAKTLYENGVDAVISNKPETLVDLVPAD